MRGRSEYLEYNITSNAEIKGRVEYCCVCPPVQLNYFLRFVFCFLYICFCFFFVFWIVWLAYHAYSCTFTGSSNKWEFRLTFAVSKYSIDCRSVIIHLAPKDPRYSDGSPHPAPSWNVNEFQTKR